MPYKDAMDLLTGAVSNKVTIIDGVTVLKELKNPHI
jgi:hypothetical protein